MKKAVELPTNPPSKLVRPKHRFYCADFLPSLTCLAQQLDLHDTLASVAWLLMEQRVLVVSPSAPFSAGLVLALESLLSPFRWTHTALPVGTSALLEPLFSTHTPFLCGALTETMEQINPNVCAHFCLVICLCLYGIFLNY